MASSGTVTDASRSASIALLDGLAFALFYATLGPAV